MRQLKILKQVTNRDTASLDKYLHDISKVDLITAEEEVELAKRIRKNDTAALNRLVKANLRFVVSVSKQYQNQGLSLPDLINEGNLGLIKAANRFDETRGFKFISYAVWWIRQSILQALAEQARIVRLPLNKIGSINKINKTLSCLEQKFERDPTYEEIANELEIAPKSVIDSLRIGNRHISMDAPISKEEDANMYDVLLSSDSSSADKKLIKESLQKEIERAIATLSYREAYVIKSFYGLFDKPMLSLVEIGDELELTRERVRQIKERAIKKLRSNTRNRLLRSYLG